MKNYTEQNFNNVKTYLESRLNVPTSESTMLTVNIRSMFYDNDPNKGSYHLEDGTKVNAKIVHERKNPHFKTVSRNFNGIFQVNDYESEDAAALEANLADAMARVGEQYGINMNDLQHLFPAVLRMLKSNSRWSK